MNNEEIFSTWAPDDALWSRWAKPVLFAYLDHYLSHIPVNTPSVDLEWVPAPSECVALVLDLPGAAGVIAGLDLAARGYRPVPLYNAIPMPAGGPIVDPLTERAVAAVDVSPIIGALRNGACALQKLNSPRTAPPAFLLDSDRSAAGRKMKPDEFDNRSVSFTTDFPSGNFLAAHGIKRVMLIQKQTLEPARDLAHSLRRWQEAGLELERKATDSPEPPQAFEIARPSWYGAMFQRALYSMGLHRASGGGFGDWLPDSSAGG
jgi:hypothetical protein